MKSRKILAAVMAAGLLLSSGVLAGCGTSTQQTQSQQAMKVNTFKPFTSDTPVMREYSGTIMALQEVPVRSKVSGTVVEKYITGGQHVTEGQPLYKIDARTYSSSLASAQANTAQARANLANARKDLARYSELIKEGAISQQAYDNQLTAVQQLEASVAAQEAQTQIASNNLGDTVVTAPFTGTLSMDDVNIGTFAAAGTTGLVTISSSDPLYVQFDMSENEYLQLTKSTNGLETLGKNLKLKLADGSIYEETGNIVQVNPGLTGGQLSLKAAFPNSEGKLVPGMFAQVVSDAEIAKGSTLIPTKALIQLLNKDMVDVVVDGKVQQKAVKLGGTYGIYTIVLSGIDVNDEIIIEGQNKVQIGQAVDPTEVTKESLEEAATSQVAGQHGTADSGK
ncbi:MAG: efflux RND transporter periplasmic adaptor subunit [Dialister sp.]|nr:efflux RND transporter periplasmic adaptor subunit [Dialister sp.]